jgi:hypothetical protein
LAVGIGRSAQSLWVYFSFFIFCKNTHLARPERNFYLCPSKQR